MLKSTILNYHASLKNSIKSSWITLWILGLVLIPAAVFAICIVFENEIAALLMKFFPPTYRQGFMYFLDIVYLARTEVLWYGFFFLLALCLAVYPSRVSLDNVLNIRTKERSIYYMMLITSAFFFMSVFTSSEILETFPNSSDEYAYLFQAEMFSRGKLWERAHDLPDFFYHNNIAQYDGILVSRFPPGWPLFLSVAFEIGLDPALVNPILGVLTLVVFYFFVRRYYGGELVALWSLIALALTGYYIFNSASYFSHVSCLLMTLLFVFNIYLYQERNKFIHAVLAGFFLGVVVIIRYYTAVLIFIPFLVYLLFQHRSRIIPLFFWMGLGGLPCLGYLLWYNYAITGNAFTPVTMWAYPEEQLGFVKGHSVLKGMEHLVRRILMFLYWCSPGVLILYFAFLWQKIKTPAARLLHPEDYAFLCLTAGYFFYYQIGGNQYGPRFMFEGLPFLIVFVVSKVLQMRQNWATALLLASIIYGVVKFPFIAHRESRIIDERQDLYDLVQEQKLRNAVVFVSSPTCSIRPMPPDDLTRNDPMFMNNVIYALELPRINEQLMNYYDDRSFYRYVRNVNDSEGELIKIR